MSPSSSLRVDIDQADGRACHIVAMPAWCDRGWATPVAGDLVELVGRQPRVVLDFTATKYVDLFTISELLQAVQGSCGQVIWAGCDAGLITLCSTFHLDRVLQFSSDKTAAVRQLTTLSADETVS